MARLGCLIDTPLSESAYVGAVIGADTCGLRPVAELMCIDFMGVCFDQIYNQPRCQVPPHVRRQDRRADPSPYPKMIP